MKKLALVMLAFVSMPAVLAWAALDDEPKKPVRKGIPTAFSASPELPPLIQAGFDAYATQGAAGALKAWTKGGAMESDAKVLASADVFHEIEKYYGQYTGFTLLKQKELAPNSQLVYIQIHYEKGPFFVRFLCYRSGGQWVLAGRLVMDTDPERVL